MFNKLHKVFKAILEGFAFVKSDLEDSQNKSGLIIVSHRAVASDSIVLKKSKDIESMGSWGYMPLY